ncbi:hypothetical protein MKX01_032374 [Papaver californicum]|nr:hypothetical protein MKX01_032374 [Papaver californicum]
MKIRSRMVMTMRSNRRASTTMIISRIIVFVAFFMILHQITSLLLIHLRSPSSSRISSTNIQGILTSQLITTNHLKAIRKQSFEQQKRPISTQPLINCDKTHKFHDICVLNMPTTLDPKISTFYVFDPFSNPSSIISKPEVHKIRPYPRKLDNTAMSRVKELTLITTSSTTKIHCQIQHQAPALVFSAEGYTGNLFHDFNDGIVPLFVTIRSLFPNGDYPILVVSTSLDWWFSKYAELLGSFTPHPIIYLENSTETHCFPSTTTIGLISHGYMTINSTLLPNSDNFVGFRSLLGAAYDGITEHNWPIRKRRRKRPILVLVGRMASAQVGRVILNQADVEFLAKRVGFEVAIFEPNESQSLSQAYELINKSHAMVGVHGAALTHSLFLRPRSVLIQVVPLGIDWLAETYFGNSAKEMGLEYTKYKIEAKESSLTQKYGKNHHALKNPNEFMKNNWSIQKDIYLKEQNVRIDLVRFGKYLKSAYKKAKHFMSEMG